jgi:hypothetical protein
LRGPLLGTTLVIVAVLGLITAHPGMAYARWHHHGFGWIGRVVGGAVGGYVGAHFGPWGAAIGSSAGSELGDKAEKYLKHHGEEDHSGDNGGGSR